MANEAFSVCLKAFASCFATVHVAISGQDVRHVLAIEPLVLKNRLQVSVVDPRPPRVFRAEYNEATLRTVKGDSKSWDDFFQLISDAMKKPDMPGLLVLKLEDSARYARVDTLLFDNLAPGTDLNERAECVELMFSVLKALAVAREESAAEATVQRLRVELSAMRHRAAAAGGSGGAGFPGSPGRVGDAGGSSVSGGTDGSGAGKRRPRGKGATLKRKANASVLNPGQRAVKRARGAQITAGSDDDSDDSSGGG